MLRRTWHTKSSLACIVLLCATFYTNVQAALNVPETSTSTLQNATDADSTINNFKCPQDCHCVIAATHHAQSHPHQFLHAKCSSLNGLKSEEPLDSMLPIHSIDLSYLGLTRLSHALDKLHDLTSIDLSHNELHEFGHLGRRIKKLNLKHNRITSSKLSKLPQHLQTLNLQHNDITNLPLEFTKMAQLKTLELSHNPINCSCETLEVRNWLQAQNVFMENAVKCSYPAEAKDKPWLQVKQADICAKEKNQHENLDTDDNEIMLGDQPAYEGSADHDDEEELGKDYMPVAEKSTGSSASNEHEHDLHVPADVEGSGDLSDMNMRLETAEEITTEKPDDDIEDGSGSGDGVPVFLDVAQHIDFGDHDDFDAPVTYTNPHAADDNEFDNKPVEEPEEEATPIPPEFHHQGIFDPDASETPSTDNPVIEPVIVKTEQVMAENKPVTENGAAIDKDVDIINNGGSTEGPEAAVMQAKVGEHDDSNATYFLLGVIALIVVGLILFVGIKRCKNRNNARHDAENPRQTELLDMDKKNLGKPLQKEHAPLIGEKSKSDMAKPINGAGKKPYDTNDVKDGANQNQPLLKNGSGNGTAPTDNIEPTIQPTDATASTLQAPHEYYPITPRYPTPKSPRASKYAQYPPQGENNNNTINADDAYLPSSPKSGRYSPVYSPETGRVKIKLTETPKPKTPMLVTRSKSNAGEIITTPVTNGNGLNSTPVVGIHTATNGHAAGHY